MKQRINNWTKLLYGFLMTILGFSGCDLDPIFGFGRVEYGQPSADFSIVGEVKSSEGKPLKGIRVIVNPERDQDDEYSKWVQDTLFTDSEGKFSKEQLKYGWPSKDKFKVTFEDIDGPENGGEFETVALIDEGLSIKQVKKGSGNWYEGAYRITADATMSPKKQD